jgi:hypothetical protein
MDAESLRTFILGLPEVDEYEHGGLPSFRVRGRRFASMLDRDGINLAPGEAGIHAAVALWPKACREEWFGRRLVAMRVDFTALDREVVEELVVDAWAARAPKRLVERLKQHPPQ